LLCIVAQFVALLYPAMSKDRIQTATANNYLKHNLA